MRGPSKRWPIPSCCLATLVIGGILLLGAAPCASAAYGFTPYGPLNNNAKTDKGQDYSPSIATDGAGTWIVVWQSNGKPASPIGDEGDIFYAVSTDDGRTWSNPDTLNTNAASDTMQDPEPVIASDGNGHWIVVWASQENLNGAIDMDWDILYSVSSDDGGTWSDPAPLNTNAATDSNTDQSPAIASDRNGHWVVVWGTFDSLGGTIGNDGDIAVARSSDNGATWTPPVALNTNATSDTGMDSFPLIVSNGVTWLAGWQVQDFSGGGYGPDADVMLARSTDNGATWSAPSPLNSNAATDASDEVAVTLSAGANGTCVAGWTSYVLSAGWEINVAYTTSADHGVTWSAPALLTTDGILGTSNERPFVATDSTGTWMVVWEAWRGLANTLGKDSDILVSVSSDDGASWGTPRALKLNAPKDDGNDWEPCLSADGSGNWIAVWSSKDTMDDTIGKDSDIFYSTTVYPQPIQIQKPNGGETYTRGVKKKMTWTTTLDPALPVRIEVWRNGNFVHRVDKSTPNDGSYRLKFPPEAEVGGGWTVRVILVNNPEIFDESDAPFRVK